MSTRQRNNKILVMMVVAIMLAWMLALAPNTVKASNGETRWTRLKQFYRGTVNKIVIDADGDLYSLAGGVWMSADGGVNWISAQRNLPSRAVWSIATDPVKSKIMYVGTDTGLFKTQNGGLTWFPSGSSLPADRIRHIVIDPQDPNMVYVGTENGIYKSTDDGVNWTAKNSGLQLTSWAYGRYDIRGLAIDPVDPLRLYAYTSRSYFHISTDGGESWTAVFGVWGDDITVSKSNPDVLYLNTEGNIIYKSTNGGLNWGQVTTPISSSRVFKMAIDPTNVNVVYASTQAHGLYKSTDGSASWTCVLELTGISDVYSSTIDPYDPSVIYAATAQGVYKSVDAGTTWQERTEGIANASVRIEVNKSDPNRIYALVRHEGVSRSEDAGQTWAAVGFEGIPIGSIVSHPTDPDTVLIAGRDTTTEKQIWKSTNGGTSWIATTWNLGKPAGAGNLAYHPLEPNKMFASTWDYRGGIVMSTDGGESWFNPQHNYIMPGEYAFHPTDPDRIWVGYARYFGASGARRMGVAYSTDGGWHWSRVEFGYGGIGSLLVDPSNPSILYGCGGSVWQGIDYRGVWKSANGGFTWSQKNTGLEEFSTSVGRVVLDSTTGTLYASTPAGVCRSEDGAESWSSISPAQELPHQLVGSLALTSDGTLLYAGTNGGIYVYDPCGLPAQNTPDGNDVEVEAIYPETGDPSPFTLIFEGVTTSGNTTVTTETGDTFEGALRLFPPNIYYDIVTTATYEGTISIAVYYGEIDLKGKPESTLRLMQFKDGDDPNWVNITDLVDEPNNVIYGTTDSLSLFAVVLPRNQPPVANAGVDQTVYAWIDGIAEVTLDGLGSSDPDGDELTYTWFIDGNQIATGESPTVELPVGVHTIELIVNDGIEDSEPDYVDITVSDGTPPAITCPESVTLECPADTSIEANGTATATDNCDQDPTITHTDFSHSLCPEVIERTWTATDDSGNTSSCVQIITVQDTTPPIITGVPADATVECDSVPPPAEPTATDNCDTDVPVTFAETRMDGDCLDNYTLTRTWTAIDNCGNTTVEMQTITVQDTTPPSLSPIPSVTILWPPNHKLHEVAIWANAFDNGSGTIGLEVEVQSSEPADGNGDGSTSPDYYIDSVDDESGVIELRLRAERSGKGQGRIYTIIITATDECGNQSVAQVQITAPHDRRKK